MTMLMVEQRVWWAPTLRLVVDRCARWLFWLTLLAISTGCLNWMALLIVSTDFASCLYRLLACLYWPAATRRHSSIAWWFVCCSLASGHQPCRQPSEIVNISTFPSISIFPFPAFPLAAASAPNDDHSSGSWTKRKSHFSLAFSWREDRLKEVTFGSKFFGIFTVDFQSWKMSEWNCDYWQES